MKEDKTEMTVRKVTEAPALSVRGRSMNLRDEACMKQPYSLLLVTAPCQWLIGRGICRNAVVFSCPRHGELDGAGFSELSRAASVWQGGPNIMISACANKDGLSGSRWPTAQHALASS